MSASPEEVDRATEALLDAFLSLTEGRADEEYVDIDAALREVAETWDIARDWPRMPPVTVAELKRRQRVARGDLARKGAS